VKLGTEAQQVLPPGVPQTAGPIAGKEFQQTAGLLGERMDEKGEFHALNARCKRGGLGGWALLDEAGLVI
jgi:hypothetical protein